MQLNESALVPQRNNRWVPARAACAKPSYFNVNELRASMFQPPAEPDSAAVPHARRPPRAPSSAARRRPV